MKKSGKFVNIYFEEAEVIDLFSLCVDGGSNEETRGRVGEGEAGVGRFPRKGIHTYFSYTRTSLYLFLSVCF